MKALILAAGYGTRLLPYSRVTPKPLFTLNSQPMLDLTIRKLQQAGFDTIIVNTHHGHEQIERFLSTRTYSAKVITRYEEDILGTGGAIRNVADLWCPDPLLVINADIVTDIDPAEIYLFHTRHHDPVTLAMHDHERFNAVMVGEDGLITRFPTHPGPVAATTSTAGTSTGAPATGRDANKPVAARDANKSVAARDANTPVAARAMAFTGMHVVEPVVLNFMPPTGAVHIVDTYQSMIDAGERLRAWEAHHHYWQDIGTPETYRSAAMESMIGPAFEKAYGRMPTGLPQIMPLKGDGSDRRWYRVTAGDDHLILADHGIRDTMAEKHEVDAFVAIGRHLRARAASVPRIVLADTFSGLVFLEDLGDQHLQTHIRDLDRQAVAAVYRHVIEQWLHMALSGARGFDPVWTCQSETYDSWVIQEKEGRYFAEAFLRDYLQMPTDFAAIAKDVQTLADNILATGCPGFMHRDLQSRNIMIKNDQAYFIDFQGGRQGPLQYDLASLLIDPYAALPLDLQDELQAYAAQAFSKMTGRRPQDLLQGYDLCALSRNMQILGAFAFLSRNRGKRQFEAYIPTALATLHHRLGHRMTLPLPKIRTIVGAVVHHLGIA